MPPPLATLLMLAVVTVEPVPSLADAAAARARAAERFAAGDRDGGQAACNVALRRGGGDQHAWRLPSPQTARRIL
jgi:hypothetical protein